MNYPLSLVPLFAVLFACTPSVLNAAEAHDDHAGHDHSAAPAEQVVQKKPHVHGAHEEEEGEGEGDEHGHDEHGGGDEVSLPAAVARTFGIVSEPAQLRTLAAIVMAPGWITYDPAGQAQISTPTSGRIVTVRVQIGETVRAGDALIEIMSPAYVEAQSTYILKRAAVLAADYQVEATTEAVARGRQAADGISGGELKRREAELRQAEVAKIHAEAELTGALSGVRLLGPGAAELVALTEQGKISDTLVLRAPIAGTIIDRLAVPGQQVDANSASLLTIANLDQLWVVANIPEARMRQVTVGSLAELYAFDGTRLGDGDIATMSPDIDPHTRSGRAQVGVAGSANVRPGMYVQVRITPLEAETGTKVVAVPEGAVMAMEGRSVVFIAEPTGDDIHFRAQPVMPGPAMAGYVPILAGLEAGTPVVVQGAFLLKADLGKEGAAHEH